MDVEVAIEQSLSKQWMDYWIKILGKSISIFIPNTQTRIVIKDCYSTVVSASPLLQ